MTLLAPNTSDASTTTAAARSFSPGRILTTGRSAELIELRARVEADLVLPSLRRRRRAGLRGKALRIVYLVPVTWPGEGARVLLEHVNQLSAIGDELTVVSHFPRPDWTELRARFIEVPLGQQLDTAIPDCDLIVAGFWDQILPARQTAIAPVVHFEQGSSQLFTELDPQTLVTMAASVRAADATMAVGSGCAAALARRFGVTSEVVRIAVDCERFRPADPSQPRRSILFVGDDAESLDGMLVARQIAVDLVSTHPEVEIVWVTPQRPSDGPFGRVVVSPPEHERAQLYREALAYVCTSRGGSPSMAVLEAMASGAVVVSSAHRGITELACHEQNALIGPAGDASALCSLVRRVLDDGVLAGHLAEAGLRTARQTTWPAAVRDVRTFFESVVLDDAPQRSQHALASGSPVDGPRTVGPRTVGPRTVGPRTVGPRTVGPRTVGPHAVDPLEAGPLVDRLEAGPLQDGTLDDGDIELTLGNVVLVADDGAASLLARARSCPTRELAIPVSRPLRGAFRSVTWEVVARRAAGQPGVTQAYIPARCEQPGTVTAHHEGLAALRRGDHQSALAALLPELQRGGKNDEAVLLRWVVVTLVGLSRWQDALALATAGFEAYPSHPDFIALEFIAATSASAPMDLEAAMRSVKLLGNGSRYREWFDDPLGLMRQHLVGGLGLQP